ncbi:TPA: hypothetical protein ACPSKE_001764 [Legionella feeleii]
MNNDKNPEDLKKYIDFKSLDDDATEHYKATISIGMIINTGAVIAILGMKNINKILNWALLFFVSSIILIFLHQFISYMVCERSAMRFLLKGETEFKNLPYYSLWFISVSYCIGLAAFLSGFLGILSSYIYLICQLS